MVPLDFPLQAIRRQGLYHSRHPHSCKQTGPSCPIHDVTWALEKASSNIWLRLQKTGTKLEPDKWKHGPKPAVCPSCLISSHTHISNPHVQSPSLVQFPKLRANPGASTPSILPRPWRSVKLDMLCVHWSGARTKPM